MSFAASVALVLDQVGAIHALRRAPRTRRLAFAIDLCLVAHRVRSGCLVDTLSPPYPAQTFAALLEGLCAKSPVFHDLACWHHAPTTQSFYVHVPLLRESLAAGGRVFVSLNSESSLSASNEPPHSLQDVAVHMLMERSHSLPDALTQETLIPFAAVVIDYPVAYVPVSSGQTSFLAGELLDVYTVSFTSAAALVLREEHVLLKFSCPRVLVHDHSQLSPPKVIERLRAKFMPRLEHVGANMLVAHHTETLDRVAL